MHEQARAQLESLTSPHLADACLSLGLPVRVAPAAVVPLVPGMACSGPARPVRHVGSIDVFLEVLERSRPGDILVIDNAGRADEACIGDIVLLEAKAAGIAGFVIWGLHRDSRELREIGLPVFSLGALPTGPQRLNVRPPDVFERALVGPHAITADDIVVADDNGVIFLPAAQLPGITEAARRVRDTEARQLAAMRQGRTFREQARFADYLARKRDDPGYGFRAHLQAIAAAGEL
jgi:regulator of RNase E activity RraA